MKEPEGYDDEFQDIYNQMGDKVIAQVGDKKLTERMLSECFQVMGVDKISREDKARFVEYWVSAQLLANEAKKKGLNKKIGNILFLDLVSSEYLSKVFVSETYKVSETDIKDYFNAHKGEFTRNEALKRFSLIAVSDRKKANDILAVIRKKKSNWDRLVERYGLEVPSTEKRGDIGYVSLEGLKREMSSKGAEAFSTSLNEVFNDYIVAKNQFFFVKCTGEKRSGEPIKYDELSLWQKNKIEDTIRNSRVEQTYI